MFCFMHVDSNEMIYNRYKEGSDETDEDDVIYKDVDDEEDLNAPK